MKLSEQDRLEAESKMKQLSSELELNESIKSRISRSALTQRSRTAGFNSWPRP